MTAPIRPALSAEEWASGRFAPEHWAEVHAHQSGELTVRTIDQPTIFKAPQRHALAALALHGLVVDGRPVGFTREMVTKLREASCCPAHDENSQVVAAIIESLLPPEPAKWALSGFACYRDVCSSRAGGVND